MDIEKETKSENGMSTTLPKFSQSEISNENISSFGIDNFDFYDSDSSIISEFMSLSLNSKIEKFKSNSSYRKLKDKNSSNTFLHYICMNDENFPMMDLIRPTIKEMDSQNNIGQTPLHISLINKNNKISTYLIENGANVNISDNNLDSSLHLAAKNGDAEIIQLLIQYKANPFLVNKNNETVLDIAIKLNHKECINLLKEISLMNVTSHKNNNNDIIKNNLNKIENLKYNINNNKTMNGNFQHIGNNILFDDDIKNQDKIQTYNKKTNFIKNSDINIKTPKNNSNLITFDNNQTEIRRNIFLSNTKFKSRQRTNSTSLIDISPNNKTYQDQIYMKKIVPRSQSGTRKNIKNFVTEISKEKGNLSNNIINNNNLITNSHNDIFIPTHQNNVPRKTDFPIQNEKLLEFDNDDNESEEEEESIIRENQEGIKPKTLSSLKYLKTLKITPLTETNNKKNPYAQIDSYVSAIHKSDQGITESDGYITEDGLLIIEPSIDISNINDTISEIQSETSNQKESSKEEEEEKKKKEKLSIKDDLYTFLKNIQMEQYNDLLVNEGFDDINLILSQMKTGLPINDDILREIGIEKPGDRAKILVRIQEMSHLFDFKIPFEATYWINKKPFKLLKYDFHVKALQNWLKKIQLQNYLENFYNNGYFSPELIFIQKASKFPINDTILERDLKINNPHERKLIMNSISSNSKNYVSELQKIAHNKKSSKSNEIKNKEKEESKCFIF